MEHRFSTKSKTLTIIFACLSVAVTLATPALVNANPTITSTGSGRVVLESQTFSASGEVTAPSISRDSYTVIPAPKPEPEVQPAMIHDVSDEVFTNNKEWDIQWPFPVGVPMSDGFGHRVKPCDSCSSDHQGVDFLPGAGSPAQAIYDGKVLSVIDLGKASYGYHVIIRHKIKGQTIDTVYGHLQTGSSKLKTGDEVKVGDEVGLVGSTGASTGAHLHFEVRVNGKAVDPIAWMKENVGVYKP